MHKLDLDAHGNTQASTYSCAQQYRWENRAMATTPEGHGKQ